MHDKKAKTSKPDFTTRREKHSKSPAQTGGNPNKKSEPKWAKNAPGAERAKRAERRGQILHECLRGRFGLLGGFRRISPKSRFSPKKLAFKSLLTDKHSAQLPNL